MEWLDLVIALALVGGSWFAVVRLLEWSFTRAPSGAARHRERVPLNRHAHRVHFAGARAEHRVR